MIKIPQLEVQDEIFWKTYKAFSFLLNQGYSIRGFEIGDTVSLKYRSGFKTIIITSAKPYCANWVICFKKWGFTVDRKTISDYTEPENLVSIIATSLESRKMAVIPIAPDVAMKQHNATEVFTDTVMGGDTDPRVFYRTLYTCPKCGGEVSFTENNFLRHSGNIVSKYGDVFKNATIKKFHSFLEFECPGCQCKTRVNYLEENGGKSPVIYIDSVLIE